MTIINRQFSIANLNDMELRQNSTIEISKPIKSINFLRSKITFRVTDSQRVITIFLALTALSLAVSVSLRSVFTLLASAIILAYIFYYKRREILQVLITPWFLAGMLFFLTVVLGCLISPADRHSQFDFIHKYSKLFYLPLFAFAFQAKQNRFWAIQAFLLGMLITFVFSVFKIYVQGLSGDVGAVFYNHIVTGYFMAFAAFLAAIYAERSQGKMRLVYVIMALLFSFHTLFLNLGRTGYVMYAVLFAIFLLYFTRHLYRCLLILIPAALCLVYQSPVVHQGVNDMIRDARNYEQGNQNSSVGHRLQFHNYAQNLFLRSPVWGVGTAAFSYYFSVENPVPSWGTVENGNKLLEPHGEYWLIAAEHGVVGLLVFFLFIIALFYEIFQTKEMRLISIGLLVTFLVGCFSDGFLLLAGPGYLLIMFAALGLGESLAGKQAQLAKRYILNREY